MCLAVPGKVLSIDDSISGLRMSTVDFGGVIKRICIQWVDVSMGEYILAHAGVALCKIDQNEALATLNDFEFIASELEKAGYEEK